MRFPCLLLASLASLLIVSGCASRALTSQKHPDASDLLRPDKPLLTDEQLASDQGLNDHDDAIEAFGDAVAAKLDRVCRWHQRMGAPVACRPAPPVAPGR